MPTAVTTPIVGTKPMLEEAVGSFIRAVYNNQPLDVYRYNPKFAGGVYYTEDMLPLLAKSYVDLGKSAEEAAHKLEEVRIVTQQARDSVGRECSYKQQLRGYKSNSYALKMALNPLIERKMKPYLDQATKIFSQMLGVPLTTQLGIESAASRT
jgi:hypothetical protein